jgi:hypothetical protein
LQQIVLSDDPVAVKHEEGQQIEDLGFEFDDLGTAAQFAARDVEPVVAKSQNHAPLQEISRLGCLTISQGYHEEERERRSGRPAFRGLPLFPGAQRAA